MNTGTAAAIITERGIPLPTLGPKPTRAEVLEAIARALHNERRKPYLEAVERLKQREAALAKRLRKHIPKLTRYASLQFVAEYSAELRKTVQTVRLYAGEAHGEVPHEVAKILEERAAIHKEREALRDPSFARILDEVKKADQLHRVERVAALTKDPDIAAKLAQVGAELLSRLPQPAKA